MRSVNIDYALEGDVFNIQRFSLNDGPGIRTIVFLKGCPLRCWWCCNPESQKLRPVILYDVVSCIHCGSCLKVCPEPGALSPENPAFVDYQKCTGCGECVAVCPAGALAQKGKKMTVQQVIREVKKDAAYYRRTGGGITISGGEPLMQYRFTAEILKAGQAQGWNTAIETTGYTYEEAALDAVLPYLDLALMDAKAPNDELHKKFTGVSNEVIKKNARRIAKEAGDTIIRVPTIPGVNASAETIREIADFAKDLGVKEVHLLPYHKLGENKYHLMGLEYKMPEDTKTPNREEMAAFKKVVESAGLTCKIGG
ncbi:glycyl-radical enzyme activating protein [Pseudoramibacter alactolyticus]|uniref:glycyl-radical enzyme activating protein n=1 Tax=Pseudoramibacter alactolyticus TaxID=113287 RepID=UPI0023532C58|nr:glycyl-radical enzyme activating protein [Pseudoramibacter alactolyticus]